MLFRIPLCVCPGAGPQILPGPQITEMWQWWVLMFYFDE